MISKNFPLFRPHQNSPVTIRLKSSIKFSNMKQDDCQKIENKKCDPFDDSKNNHETQKLETSVSVQNNNISVTIL